jgi:hypothetical protein
MTHVSLVREADCNPVDAEFDPQMRLVKIKIKGRCVQCGWRRRYHHAFACKVCINRTRRRHGISPLK